MLPARHRLRRAADFTAVVRGPGSTRAGGRLMVVHAVATPGLVSPALVSPALVSPALVSPALVSPGLTHADLPPRVGFVVSKAVGGAVVRNRTKRVLRHLVAARLDGIPDGFDLVVRANPAAAEASTAELGAELDAGLRRVLRRSGREARR